MTLRRTGGLTRHTELRSATPLSRSSELTRTGPIPRSSPIRTQAEIRASRPTVSREEREARRLVRERAAGTCEGCGRAPAVEYSHRVGRGQGGPWHPANALHLCGPDGCHLWATHNRTEARSVGWILRSTDDFLTFPALLHGRGLVLLTPGGEYAPAPINEGDDAA